MSTVAINLNHALHEGLAAAQLDIKQANSNVAMRTKLIQWLEGWISKGAPGTVSQRIDAARSVFAAQQDGANVVLAEMITGRLNNLQTSFTTLFEAMPNSSRATLAVIPHSNLKFVSTAINGLSGKADKGTAQEMNMLMHSLIEEATKLAKESEAKNKGAEFTVKLRELVSKNEESFTKDFLNNFALTVAERQAEQGIDSSIIDITGNLDSKLKLDQAMDLFLLEKEGKAVIDLGERNINKDYEEWSALDTKVREKAQKEAGDFFANIANWTLDGMDTKTKIKVIQEQFNSIKDPNAKLLVRIKVQEEKTRANLAKHQDGLTELFGKLFGEGFGSQALATLLVGFAGGSLLGMPMLGIFFTGIISLLGRMQDSKTIVTKATPPKVATKVTEQQVAMGS